MQLGGEINLSTKAPKTVNSIRQKCRTLAVQETRTSKRVGSVYVY